MSLQNRLTDLVTAIATDYKQLRTWVTGSSSGSLAGLTTAAKTDLIAAINEINASVPADATANAKGIVELATLAEVAAGTSTSLVVTPEGVRQERASLKAEILGADVPAALDTLDELAAALGDDADFAASVTTALGNRVLITDIGNPDTDLVAEYTAAKT